MELIWSEAGEARSEVIASIGKKMGRKNKAAGAANVTAGGSLHAAGGGLLTKVAALKVEGALIEAAGF